MKDKTNENLDPMLINRQISDCRELYVTLDNARLCVRGAILKHTEGIEQFSSSQLKDRMQTYIDNIMLIIDNLDLDIEHD